MFLKRMKFRKEGRKKKSWGHISTCGGILIAGIEMFIDYITQRIHGPFGFNRYGEMAAPIWEWALLRSKMIPKE